MSSRLLRDVVCIRHFELPIIRDYQRGDEHFEKACVPSRYTGLLFTVVIVIEVMREGHRFLW